MAHEMAPYGLDQIRHYQNVTTITHTVSNNRSDRCIMFRKVFRRRKVCGIEILEGVNSILDINVIGTTNLGAMRQEVEAYSPIFNKT